MGFLQQSNVLAFKLGSGLGQESPVVPAHKVQVQSRAHLATGPQVTAGHRMCSYSPGLSQQRDVLKREFISVATSFPLLVRNTQAPSGGKPWGPTTMGVDEPEKMAPWGGGGWWTTGYVVAQSFETHKAHFCLQLGKELPAIQTIVRVSPTASPGPERTWPKHRLEKHDSHAHLRLPLVHPHLPEDDFSKSTS